jgi:hypothetical protein
MARAGRIAVRQLIHQNQRRAAGEGGVEIELLRSARGGRGGAGAGC